MIKDKTRSSALCVMTYEGEFRKGRSATFPFLINDATMTAMLHSGQALSFKINSDNDGKMEGLYASSNPGDTGHFQLTMVQE